MPRSKRGGRKARVYTLVNLFSLGDGETVDQCNVSHYRSKEDAVRAFTSLLRSRCEEPAQGGRALFDDLLSRGHGYTAFTGSDEDWYFVRHEQIQCD